MDTLPPEQRTAPSNTRTGSFLLFFLLFNIALACLVFALASTPWFVTHDNYPELLQEGYGMRLSHADCDIVLYGDSTALTGLDPQIIQRITGLKTCNVAEGIAIQGVVGSRFPLDAYLHDNQRPRFILAMRSAQLFNFDTRPFTLYSPEGIIYGLQYERNRTFYFGLLRRPYWIARFYLWAGNALIDDLVDRHGPGPHRTRVDTGRERARHDGQFLFPLPPQTHCVPSEDPNTIHRYQESVSAFRQRYAVGGTTVLTYLTPIADCESLRDLYAQRSQGLHDNPLAILPIRDFNDGPHPDAEGSRYISTYAGQQILALENQQKAAPAAAQRGSQ